MSRVRSVPALAALIGLFFLALYLLTGAADLRHNGDTDLRYQTTQALVDNGRLWIAHPLWTDSRLSLGLGHHLYAFYGPGQVLLMAPLYVAGKVIAHHLNLPYDITTLYATRSLDLFLGAALTVVFFLFALSAGYTRRVCVLLTLVFGAATVAWPDAQSALEQTQVDLFLLVGALFLWRFVRGALLDRRLLAGAGAGVGLAVLTRYDALLYLPAFGVYLVWLRASRCYRWSALVRDLAAFAAASAPFLLAVGLWDTLRFGSPFITGLHEQTLGNPFLLGLAELLVSPGKGLCWYLPLLFVLPWAVPRFARRVPALGVLCAILVLLPLIFYANVVYWHGDPAWGPRYLYVAVPYLVLPVGEILATWPRRAWSLRALTLLAVLAGLTLSVTAVSVTEWRFWYRMQADQETNANFSTWSGQPFRWGVGHYHYYWQPMRSPIVVQVDGLYQIVRIQLGDSRYVLSGRPDPFVSSTTAELYPVNSFNFWWADILHPLLGPRTRAALALLLAFTAGASLCVLLLAAGTRREGEQVRSRERDPAAASLRPA